MDVGSDSTFTEISFTIGHCSSCDRPVLTYPASTEDDERVHCVHCDAAVTEGLRPALGDELPDHGYGLLELQGCGNPDCGGGACGRQSQEEAET